MSITETVTNIINRMPRGTYTLQQLQTYIMYYANTELTTEQIRRVVSKHSGYDSGKLTIRHKGRSVL